MHRTRSSMLVLITVLTVLASTIAPASAAEATAVPADVAEVDVRPIPAPTLEVLRLRCRGALNTDDMPEVRCKWTAPTVDSAHQLVLERNDGNGWRPLWRTARLERTRYVDGSIETGVRYRYRIRVYDAEKNLVAASRSNGAGVPSTPIDVLRINCAGATTDDGKAAKCEWTASDDARGYQLWRIVNRHHRELVGTYDAATFAARDGLPDDALVVRYAVLALDSEGEIIGRSRPTTIRFRNHSAA